MKIQCHTGIAGRVVAIANGLHLFGEIEFGWVVNRHCPCEWNDLFPDGIPGVEFVAHDLNRGMTRINRVPIDTKIDGVDYMQVIGQMIGEPITHDCSIIARFFRHPEIKPCQFVASAVSKCHGSVFILADTHRAYIADALRRTGRNPVLPESSPMTHDMDRSRESVIAFARDWKTTLAARKIITHEQESGLTMPALNAVRIQS